jgi:hypothetical protein
MILGIIFDAGAPKSFDISWYGLCSDIQSSPPSGNLKQQEFFRTPSYPFWGSFVNDHLAVFIG